MDRNTFNKQLAEKYGLSRDDFWQLKRGGNATWCLSHAAVQRIAAAEGIQVTLGPVIEATPDRKALLVTAVHGDRTMQMVGECVVAGKGPQSEFAWAMAQKRGEDKAILALIAPGWELRSDAEDLNTIGGKEEEEAALRDRVLGKR